MAKKYKLLSELNYDQKCHFAWRGDRYTGSGLISISKLARGGYGDMTVYEAFKQLDMNDHQAKKHATKVMNYDIQTYKPIK